MGSIRPFLRHGGVFDPTDIKAMSMALDDVCKVLNLPTSGSGEPRRDIIAGRIIALAQAGERSPTRLRDRVLTEASSAQSSVPWSGG